ncbi:3-deoxy-D-manno-octulosonic-acid transferase [Wenxinia saemankumensis]|uniref:3-deoxy-D-manno-octulosonic acid transferase n=1 Tax=Wenxinia saemankumensis TaxID=1447782 RepID=A0A1M6E311_9RHOB|nr:3-deoxy-D-manno-octulosonic-acid transferase [Wenxinia saemankumensis]
MVWIHASRPDIAARARVLAQRIEAAEEGAAVMLTGTGPGLAPPPPDQMAAVRGFLAHWRPDALVWLGGDFRPVLLAECELPREARCLAEIDADGLQIDGGSWMPGVLRPVLSGFGLVLPADAAVATRMRRLGLPPEALGRPGTLGAVPPPLPVRGRDHADLLEALGPRPIWLAAGAPAEEAALLVAAQRHAAHRTHRLLMVAAPATPEEAEPLAAALEAEGLVVRRRAEGEEPDEPTDAYIADGCAEMGLWYRLAPVTYLGGSLTGRACRSPFEAASLGSALLVGPQTDPHGEAARTLRARSALRELSSPDELGPALESLLSPETAARLARSAWDVATEGAEATDAALSFVAAALEREAA